MQSVRQGCVSLRQLDCNEYRTPAPLLMNLRRRGDAATPMHAFSRLLHCPQHNFLPSYVSPSLFVLYTCRPKPHAVGERLP